MKRNQVTRTGRTVKKPNNLDEYYNYAAYCLSTKEIDPNC